MQLRRRTFSPLSSLSRAMLSIPGIAMGGPTDTGLIRTTRHIVFFPPLFLFGSKAGHNEGAGLVVSSNYTAIVDAVLKHPCPEQHTERAGNCHE